MMTTKQLDELAWQAYPFTFRNNRGQGWLLNRDRNGKTRRQYITFGIPEPPRGKSKSKQMRGGDRIGWTPVTITPDMVGKTVAVFTSIEIKSKGDRIREGQDDWHNTVIDHGGISEIWIEREGDRVEVIRERIE